MINYEGSILWLQICFCFLTVLTWLVAIALALPLQHSKSSRCDNITFVSRKEWVVFYGFKSAFVSLQFWHGWWLLPWPCHGNIQNLLGVTTSRLFHEKNGYYFMASNLLLFPYSFDVVGGYYLGVAMATFKIFSV